MPQSTSGELNRPDSSGSHSVQEEQFPHLNDRLYQDSVAYGLEPPVISGTWVNTFIGESQGSFSGGGGGMDYSEDWANVVDITEKIFDGNIHPRSFPMDKVTDHVR